MAGKVLKIFYPASTVQNAPPLNLEEKDRELFKSNFQIHLPKSGLYQLNNVFVTDLGIIYNNLSAVKENIVCYDIDFKNYRLRYFLKSVLTFGKRRFRGTKAIIIFDNYSGPNGFAHWICDGLTRLAEINETLDDYTVIVPEYFEQQKIYRESLKLFNIRNIHYLPKQSLTFFNKLYFPSPIGDTGNFHPDNIKKLRDIVDTRFGTADSTSKNIYISRAKAKRRFVENEDAVVQVLKKYNFEVIYMEDYLFPEQIKIIRSANNIVSIHGAALALLMFAQKGTSVLELRNSEDATNNMYYLLANVCDLNYYYLNCKSTERAKNANSFDLLVNLSQLEKNIELICAKNAI